MGQIRFVLERFFYGWKMNALVYDNNDVLWEFCLGTDDKVSEEYIEDIKKVMFDDIGKKELFYEIKQKSKSASIPVLYLEEDGIYYLAFQDREENFFIFGPASADTLSFSQQAAYRKRHHVSDKRYQVPRVSFAKSLNGIALVYYMLTGCQVTEEAIMKVSEYCSSNSMRLLSSHYLYL